MALLAICYAIVGNEVGRDFSITNGFCMYTSYFYLICYIRGSHYSLVLKCRFYNLMLSGAFLLLVGNFLFDALSTINCLLLLYAVHQAYAKYLVWMHEAFWAEN